MKNVPHILLLGLLLLASGAAGLSYEVVWLRMLSNVLGSSAAATATVLAVFMGGMAAGALALGPRADRSRRPLVLYAVLEALLALCALALPFCLSLVARLDAGLEGGGAALLGKAISAACILFVPTFVMGGTLPAMIAHLARRRWNGGRAFGLLYGLHVLGAAGGALTASFFLIGNLGLRNTCMAGAVINLLVAVAALALARTSEGTESEPEEDSTDDPAVAETARVPLMGTAFIGGFVLLASEVIYVRTLVLVLQAKVHSFSLMLSTFLVGLSLGSLIVSLLPTRWVRRGGAAIPWALALGAGGLLLSREIPLRWAVAFLLGGSGVEPTDAPGLIRGLVDLVSDESGRIESPEYLRLSIVLSAITILPFAIPSGMIFPLLLRRAAFGSRDPGRRGGQLVFWNTLGAVAGPVLAAYVFVPRCALQGTQWIFALALFLTAAAWWWGGRRGSSREGLAFAGLGALVLGLALAASPRRFEGSPRLDAALWSEVIITERPAPRILRHVEGTGGTVTVIEDSNRRRALRLNGFEAAGMAVESVNFYHYMRLMGHLPLLLRGPRQVERALIICCGTGSTAGAVASYEGVKADLVDLHQEVLDALPLFEQWNHGVATNERCRLIADDGRSHLRRHQDTFDVITLEPMPPRYAGMTQLYSQEFYEDCREALRDGGVVCQWLPLHLMSYEDGLSAVKALAEVFDKVQVWHHQGTYLLTASDSPMPITLDHFNVLMRNPQAAADLKAANLHHPLALMDAYLCSVEDLTEGLARVESVRDDRPSLEYATIEYGLTRISPVELRRAEAPYVEARLRSEIPVEGIPPKLETAWGHMGQTMWVKFLIASDRRDEAGAYWDRLVRTNAFFRNNRQLRQAMRQALRR